MGALIVLSIRRDKPNSRGKRDISQLVSENIAIFVENSLRELEIFTETYVHVVLKIIECFF